MPAAVKIIFRVLFGAWNMPPLSRREFLRRGAVVLLPRYPVCFAGAWLLSEYGGSLPFPEKARVLALGCLCCFLVPYFRIMHRRLRGMGFPWPLLVVLGIIALLIYSPILVKNGVIPNSDWFFTAALAAVYALLLPWPDRAGQVESHPEARE